MPNTVHVSKLSASVSVEDLQQHFSKFGVVNDVYIPKDFVSGESRGFACIEFKTAEMVDACCVAVEHDIRGEVCEVRKVEPKERSREPDVPVASEIADEGVLEIVESGVGEKDESLEGLAAQLFKQIRESDFLENNKPQGESLFAIAARQAEEKVKSSTTAAAPKPSLFQRIADASKQEPPPKPSPAQPSSSSETGKPTFQDALQAILQDLDDNASQAKGGLPNSGSTPATVENGGESFEGLMGQLFQQIRAGGLEQCEPQGESFVANAARQEEEKQQQQQAKGGGSDGLFQKISTAALQQAPTSVESSAGKPKFQDALQAILQDLDDNVPHANGNEPVLVSAEQVATSGSAPPGEESFEGLVGQLFSQIRAGGLDQCEPQGESLFAIAARQEEEKKQQQAKSSNGLFQKISEASNQAPAATQPSKAASGKPSFEDALGTILQELDAGAASRSPAQAVGQDDGDDLVAAFKAMAPTLGALFKDLAGDLETEEGGLDA